MKLGKRACEILIVFLLMTATIFIFDFVSYCFLPDHFLKLAEGYRGQPIIRSTKVPEQAWEYPPGYFIEDKRLGFDIAPNITGQSHRFSDATFEIFSNELGCFDHNSLEEIKEASVFDYFAGDSFAWGFAEYNLKFATVYEKRTGRTSAKCGVTHTGQIHQFEKFRRTVKLVGHYPKRVFVAYCTNDPSNDYTYPHSTVIDGFLVDIYESNGGRLVSRNMAGVKEKMQDFLHQSEKKFIQTEFLRQYSITFHLVAAIKRQLVGDPTAQSFYHMEKGQGYDFSGYSQFEFTEPNRKAIQTWNEDAKKHGYQLIFVLIPPRDRIADKKLFISFRSFLSDLKIEHVDLQEAFTADKKDKSELYWKYNLHLNNSGNSYIGELLARRYK